MQYKTLKQIADKYGIPKRTLQSRARIYKIPHIDAGGVYLYTPKSIQKLIKPPKQK